MPGLFAEADNPVFLSTFSFVFVEPKYTSDILDIIDNTLYQRVKPNFLLPTS